MTDPYEDIKDFYEESMVNPNVRDEVLKLVLIVRAKMPGGPPIHRRYLNEKLSRILEGVPIALHPTLQLKFNHVKGPQGFKVFQDGQNV